ncbi:sulfite exporter TauE/SafE family protein [Kineococcus rubinsiae]|uniref:sulfite exporter TauE/SafE family protein n=1 Tax=Kineococcus rubinsiae TaxID=2609562 RepID=UPI001431248F|nr:sulfite exporter TauE/SafE family protein [Kineococcus rubinsiae]NIZ90440.1 sulfite exporter TauE/SafE family protein [Kineococcus rubinsiae]
MAVVVVLGLGIGLVLGLLGGGGSVLAVPALVYGADVPLASAVLTSLLVVGTSSVTAVLPRRRLVQWRLAALLAAAGVAPAFAGAALNRVLAPSVVLVGFAAVMVVAGVRMLTPARAGTASCVRADGSLDWRRTLPRAVPAGLGVGLLTGLFGVGGGFLVVPVLVLLLGLPAPTAVATSLVVVALNSAAGLAAHAGDAEVDAGVTVAFTAAAVAGSLVAARLAARVPEARLRRAFAVLVLLVAALVLAENLLGASA